MPDNSSFEMSSGFDVIPPKWGQALPIPCDEWDHLKERVGNISDRMDIYHTLGSILIGAGISTLIAILTGAIDSSPTAQDISLVISWSVVVAAIFCGCVCLWFSRESKSVNRIKARDVVKQMEIIENRYERKDAA